MEAKSLSECEVCLIEMQKVETTCCDSEYIDNSITITSQNPVCCQDEFIYNKVEDDFVNNTSEIAFYSTLLSLASLVSIIPKQFELSITESYYTDSSPPFLINPKIHITNSSFLI
jgi:hypothetical protein